jgi:hypothetical protein
MQSSASTPSETPVEIRSLLQHRDQLRGWLERLRTVDDGTPARIAERVRADYTARLEEVTRELSEHAEMLEAELAQLRVGLERADGRAAEAADALTEAHLRHRIGELPPELWEERRPVLEGAAESAEQEASAAREAVGRLAELVGEIAGAAAELPPVGVAAEPDLDEEMTQPLPWLDPGAENGDEARDGELAFLELPADPEEEAAAEPSAVEGEGDLAFLEELDRAIAASIGRDPGEATQETPAAESGPATVACRECGSANDAQAWYCEICGSEL